tara:strand:+ start:190 stop:489 length:300 start_codon:yes stop_codon:yes gene_type:complete
MTSVFSLTVFLVVVGCGATFFYREVFPFFCFDHLPQIDCLNNVVGVIHHLSVDLIRNGVALVSDKNFGLEVFIIYSLECIEKTSPSGFPFRFYFSLDSI